MAGVLAAGPQRMTWLWGYGVGGVIRDAWFWSPPNSRWHPGVALGFTAVAGIAIAAAIIVSSRRGNLKPIWLRRKREPALTKDQWQQYFTEEGKFADGGINFLRTVRCGGAHPEIRREVWPFLLGVYILESSEIDRREVRAKNRVEYIKLRGKCLHMSVFRNQVDKELDETVKADSSDESCVVEDCDSVGLTKATSAEERLPTLPANTGVDTKDEKSNDCSMNAEFNETSDIESRDNTRALEQDPSRTSSSNSPSGNVQGDSEMEDISSKETSTSCQVEEDFATWQRIIRLDAVRANAEWVSYSPKQAAVLKDEATKFANTVNLQDYEHLEPCRIYHAARLVAILEAYALHDPEIGYCQGMSDLLSPLLAVVEEDDEAFWCFVGFMKKARHNFRLDEVGIRRQLNIVSKIIKFKDSDLYKHLEKLRAEDCFFVYRMVVVMFRRELTFEQTLFLWEVMWADQAAYRAWVGKSTSSQSKLRVPPTDDLLLYAIAACVLERRKLIIESYSSMEEILRECNSMTGQLDVWKLLGDAHDLVTSLHDKI